MFPILKVFVLCFCVHFVLGRPSKHSVEKRWAYIENSDPQMRSIHTDCKKIVSEYSDGQMPFYEYKAKMKKCMDRQERTNIPSYEDMDEFTPSFNVPTSSKRFETPRNFQQQQDYNQYPNYAYNYNQYQNQNGYGAFNQRTNIATPQDQQYAAPQQAQAFPSSYYYPQSQPQQQMNTRRSDIPSYPQEEPRQTMYDTTIVKKDEIPRPDQQLTIHNYNHAFA